jgi:hypothetical protein
MKNTWTRTDDMLVCMSYLADGETVTPELRAALPHHADGSIGARLGNFRYLASAGASGLPNYAAQSREVWAIIQRAAVTCPGIIRQN